MISLISMVAHTITVFFVYVLKAFFSMLLWFFRLIFKLIRLFFCALPVTCLAFAVLTVLNIVVIVCGLSSIPYISGHESFFLKEISTASGLFIDLKKWWITDIYAYHGSFQYLCLLILTVIMAVPVCCTLLFLSTFLSFGSLLFFGILADMAVYLIRAFLSKSFASQFLDRYYRLFPVSGKKHYEKKYENWLKNHHEEYEKTAYRKDYGKVFRNIDDFNTDDEYDDDYDDRESWDEYEDDYEDDYDEDFDNDYYNESDDEYDGEYDDDYDEESDDEYDDDYGDEPDEYDYDFNEFDEHRKEHVPATSFDFFAGCRSLESVDRKYKSLVKLYHPDNADGDTAALQEINVQYTNAKKKFKNQQ